MKFDFNAVDTHMTTLQGVLGAMDENLNHLRSLRQQLLDQFHGAGADGYQTTMNAFSQKLDTYGAMVTDLKIQVQQTSGIGGLMHVTDKNNGNKFLSI